MKLILVVLLSLNLLSCSKSKKGHTEEGISLNQRFFQEIGAVKAYQPTAKYAKAMEDCIYRVERNTGCPLDTLPLIGQEIDDLTIEDLKSRIVATHTWMSTRMIQFLSQFKNDQDLMKMLKSVTAIVISAKITTSFYNAYTGAIYLTPYYLFLTRDEYQSIEYKEDVRSTRSEALKFFDSYFYAKDQQRITQFTYDFELKKYALARLLYHELSHANEFFPHHTLAQLPMGNQNLSQLESDDNDIYKLALADYQGLKSETLTSLARYVNYGKSDGSVDFQTLEAADIVSEFESDTANDLYNYANDAENFAMKLEEFLMLKNHSIYRYLSIIESAQAPDGVESTTEAYWTEGARIVKTPILESVLKLYTSLFPDSDLSEVKNKMSKHSSKVFTKTQMETLLKASP